MTLAIEFVIEDEAWTEAAPWYRERALRISEAVLEATGHPRRPCEYTILLTSDARIAELNAEFRGKPAATNVLSWPAETITPEDAPVFAEDDYLGDIAIARETVEKEAEAQHVDKEDHVTHLIAHGMLHLLGYDHMDDAQADRMEAIERRALSALGIADPYAPRGPDE